MYQRALINLKRPVNRNVTHFVGRPSDLHSTDFHFAALIAHDMRFRHEYKMQRRNCTAFTARRSVFEVMSHVYRSVD